jgi:membrane protease YdiL (CAAX protease family)
LIAAFLAIWIPYIAATGLQERFHAGGIFGPLLMVVSFAMAWLMARSLRSSGQDNPFGLRVDRSTVALLLSGIVAMFVARTLIAFFAIGTGIATLHPAASAFAVLLALAGALLIGAIPALAEDILTRGFPLFAARKALPPAVLIFISAGMYALNHLWRLDWGATEQLRLFCMGIAYAIAAWRFRSLWAAFALHLGWNAGSALVPIDILNDAGFRLATSAIHLVLAGVILALPIRRRAQSG